MLLVEKNEFVLALGPVPHSRAGDGSVHVCAVIMKNCNRALVWCCPSTEAVSHRAAETPWRLVAAWCLHFLAPLLLILVFTPYPTLV